MGANKCVKPTAQTGPMDNSVNRVDISQENIQEKITILSCIGPEGSIISYRGIRVPDDIFERLFRGGILRFCNNRLDALELREQRLS